MQFSTYYNSSTVGYQLKNNVYQLPYWAEIMVWIVFSCVIALSVGGNGIVIWIVLAHRNMRCSTNYFLLNLSFSDILLTTFMVIPNVLYSINNNWIFGIHYCRFSYFLTCFCISLSVFTFMAIAFDRHVAIMNPLRPRASKKKILCAIAFIWIISGLTGVPSVIVSTVEADANISSHAVLIYKCFLKWPSHSNQTILPVNYQLLYDVSLLLLQYVIPMVVVTVIYVPLSLHLWRHQTVGEYSRAQAQSLKSKKKVVRMMIAVVIIFAVSWLPYQGFFFIGHIGCDFFYDWDEAQGIFLFVYFVAMSNSLYNPIIYAIMNKRFRFGFKQVFQNLLRMNYLNVNRTTENLNASNFHEESNFRKTRLASRGAIQNAFSGNIPLLAVFADDRHVAEQD